MYLDQHHLKHEKALYNSMWSVMFLVKNRQIPLYYRSIKFFVNNIWSYIVLTYKPGNKYKILCILLLNFISDLMTVLLYIIMIIIIERIKNLLIILTSRKILFYDRIHRIHFIIFNCIKIL